MADLVGSLQWNGAQRELRNLQTPVRAPFSAPGDYSVPVAYSGQAFTSTRASTATYTRGGVEYTAATNRLRVSDSPLGALIEASRTQAYPTPDAPAAATTGSLATGSWIFWVVGSGSQAISAGTATATGWGTATAASPVVLNVTGAGTAVLGSVTGSLSFAQLENGSFATSKMHTAMTRAADNLTVPCPFTPADSAWLFDGMWTPENGSAWNAQANRTLISVGTYGTANSSFLFYDSTGMHWYVRDSANTLHDASSLSGWTTGHRVTIVNAGGNMTMYRDGLSVATATGGVISAWPTTINVGWWPTGAGRELSGSLSYLLAARLGDRATAFRIAGYTSAWAIGDSITAGNGLNPYTIRLQALLGPSYAVENNGIGATTAADMVGRWTNTIRPYRPSYLMILAGVNDIRTGCGTAACTEPSLQTMYDQAMADGTKVIAVTLLPFKGDAYWTSGLETERLALNTWIRNYVAAHPTQMALVDAAPDFDDGTGALKAIYDSGDHIHPNQAGFDHLADMIAPSFP
jgi:lysophospholipase L1-like esterase